MNIDDKKLQELIEKEVKEQIGKKIKAFNKTHLTNIFQEVAEAAISEILKDKANELQEKLEKEFIKNKEQISETISNKIANKLTNSFVKSLIEDDEDDYDDYYRDDWD